MEYGLWNGQREEFYRGEGTQLLTMRHFPDGAEGQSYWYHHDGRGSVAGVTKHEGQSTHNYRYDAYGQVLPALGNFTDPHNHYTFSGKEWDEHLNTYEFGYRLYDPWAGVWLTRDPMRGEPRRPRTLHRYAYAFASPISYYDRYGLQGEGPQPQPVPTPPPTPTPGPTPTPAPPTPPTPTPSPQRPPTPPYTPTPTPTGAELGNQCWRMQVLQNLMSAGPYGQATAQYIIASNVQLGFREQETGAMWWIDRNIYLSADSYSLRTRPDAPFMLSLIAHEARHLEQGPVVALSVYGELEAWQVLYAVHKELTGQVPSIGTEQEWQKLFQIPLSYSRDDLETARQLMQSIAGPDYSINKLPLWPLPAETGYQYGWSFSAPYQ